jgi:hypothetical protein
MNEKGVFETKKAIEIILWVIFLVAAGYIIWKVVSG